MEPRSEQQVRRGEDTGVSIGQSNWWVAVVPVVACLGTGVVVVLVIDLVS